MGRTEPAAGPVERTLVFVYNVDGSPVALLRDLFQGLRTGSTDCHLCDLTFGRLLKDRTWSAFVAHLPVAVDFRLRSRFIAAHPELASGRFPAVFSVEDHRSPVEVIGRDALDGCADLDMLRDLVERTVAAWPEEGDVGTGSRP